MSDKNAQPVTFSSLFLNEKRKSFIYAYASEELGTIKRKQKKQIKEFDPLEDIEEEKKYKSKRPKHSDDKNKRYHFQFRLLNLFIL